MDAFTITILEEAQVIQIPFGASDGSTPGATFTASSGAKSSIQVNVGQPTFLGALDFVNTLEQFLSDIGGSGVSIDVGPTQISASLSLSLPSVGVGVFNLENLALSASVVVPFLGGATVATFGFCSQEQPFSLTVLCFGGGGYLLVGVGLHSLQSLTASFDFEGQLALDLGVASGGVSVMAGITFSYAAGHPGSTLTGFVRITGEVEVLGILEHLPRAPAVTQLHLAQHGHRHGHHDRVGQPLLLLRLGRDHRPEVVLGARSELELDDRPRGPVASAAGPASAAHALRLHDLRPVGQHLPDHLCRSDGSASDWPSYCKAFAG